MSDEERIKRLDLMAADAHEDYTEEECGFFMDLRDRIAELIAERDEARARHSVARLALDHRDAILARVRAWAETPWTWDRSFRHGVTPDQASESARVTVRHILDGNAS